MELEISKQIEQRAIDYAQAWYEANDLETEKKHGNDLYLRVNDNVFTEVSHCDIRQKATLWLESELEGVNSY
ncbi:MAG: hypothetical protein CBB92_14870 [Flammeovirgaceae bacterium TMED32]|nr:MAG: hypothetical protein CBB92_14870 [Flammeovirgaceae bacterium TMED32]|tara:strand:+ start:1031 stop:1246 length:216 start_codon:yes stop_codon:yes gene_type:complete